MGSTTTNLELEKPSATDKVNLSVINSNYDKIDAFAGIPVNYNTTTNKPSINGVTLTGNTTATQLSLSSVGHKHNISDIEGTVATEVNFSEQDKTKLNGIESGANNYVLQPANSTTLGGVKVDGTTITADENGVISAVGGGGSTPYTLPTASTTTLGGVKIDGTSITISNGVISATGGSSGGTYTETTLFQNDAGVTSFELSQTITNFDAIAFTQHADGEHTSSQGTTIIPSSIINAYKEFTLYGFGDRYRIFITTDNKNFTTTSGNNLNVCKVVGIKYGSSSGGGNCGVYSIRYPFKTPSTLNENTTYEIPYPSGTSAANNFKVLHAAFEIDNGGGWVMFCEYKYNKGCMSLPAEGFYFNRADDETGIKDIRFTDECIEVDIRAHADNTKDKDTTLYLVLM